MLLVSVLLLELGANTTSVAYASTQTEVVGQSTEISNEEVDKMATELKKMFSDGFTQENLNRYANKNFSKSEIRDAEEKLGVSLQLSNSSDPRNISLFSWNKFGKCMYNKVKDEVMAMVNVGVFIKYAKRKAWKELAKIVLRAAKGAGVKTNVYLLAGNLAIWAVSCGIEMN